MFLGIYIAVTSTVMVHELMGSKMVVSTSSNKLGVVRKNHRIMWVFPLCFRIQLLGKRAMNVGATFRKLRSFARIGDRASPNVWLLTPW
jgi:hypothetical protein